MLEARGLGYVAGQARLLSGVTARFAAGAVTGLIGPNGAGKSTLLRLLAGLEAPTEGQVLCQGVPLSRLPIGERARVMAYLPQDVPPFPPMPVREVASLGRLAHGENAACALHHPAVQQALDMTGLTQFGSREASRLSGGERARLTLARALAVDAPILLADEPVAALDPAQALMVMQVLRGLAAQGRCVVVVIHDLLLATRFCDTLVLLREGELQDVLPPADLTDARVRSIYCVTTRRVENGLVPWGLSSPGKVAD
ncbi:MAG: ABC transporter ATP-binding protein [Acetobacter peroxydans]|jgi:iron complex transport system ATP-binding protein|nr:ABC transporter ATP-binding protein [Acetobacter peroxydans]MCI2008220.1 ABC transporter ATP-binding protein [Acetobacter peroxydans]MCI2077911.1 ABC transporter ATP-binding protein [Acetobacter peroxydans]